MRHIYITRKGFFIINLINGGLISLCILPLFKFTSLIDRAVYNLRIFPDLFMSINLDYIRAISPTSLLLTVLCFSFFAYTMFIRLMYRIGSVEDGLYQFMDEINEGYRIDVNEGIQITDDMRPDHLKGDYNKIDTNYRKVVATSEVESHLRISSLKDNSNEQS